MDLTLRVEYGWAVVVWCRGGVWLLGLGLVACGGGGKPAKGPPASLECASERECRAACETGDGPSCNALGTQYETGKGVKQDYERAAQLYGMACEHADATGCYNLGVLAEIGLGHEEDPERARGLYEKACEGGYIPACERLEE